MALFHPPTRIEAELTRALLKMMREWVRLPEDATLDEIFAALGNADPAIVVSAAGRLAMGMVTQVAKGNAVSWRHAAAKSAQGRRIHDLLTREMSGPVGQVIRGLVADHARLIRSMPQSLAQDVAKQIATRQMRGERAQTIAADIRKRFPHITHSHIAMLARTQVASTATSISQARAENLGCSAYEWLTSEDSRVRLSHRKMDHVIVLWSDPPSPEALVGEKSRLGRYNAGQTVNCRCDANVIIDLDQIQWPAKVHVHGSIVRMTRAKFAAYAGYAR